MSTVSEPCLHGRVILVTGASRGIGYMAARALAAAGAHIIALGRTQGALEALDDVISADSGKVTLVPVDLKHHDSLDQLGAIIHERWQHLDGFLANAGILGDITLTPHIEPKIMDELIAVNFTANYRLIRVLDPLLRASPAGRAVFISSGVTLHPRPFWGGYSASKAALNALVLCYAQEIANTSLKVNLLNPGAMATAMRAKAMPGENPDTLPKPSALAPLIMDMLSPEYRQNAQFIHFRDTDYFHPLD